jgi:tRNA 2-thiouridine synthesizing protein A
LYVDLAFARQELVMEVNQEVDARGLNCPLPILRAKKALSSLQSGQILKVLSTDPGSKRDFQAFAKQTGNELVQVEDLAKEWAFYLKRR